MSVNSGQPHYDSFGSNAIKTFSVSTADLTQWHIYNASSAPGTWTARLNGETIFSTTSNTVGFLTAPSLGMGSSYYYDGDVAEVIVFDRTLTAAERNLVGRYLYAQNQPPAITLPTTPQPLQAQNSGSGEAWVTWPVSTNQIPSADYVLERKGTDNQWREIATLSQDRSTYLDRDLAPGTYTYRLKSRSWAGDAAYSNTPAVTIATAAPASVPATGLRLWLRADLGVITDATGAVQQWTDLSQNANNATQATAASRPVLATAPTADAHPVIRFTRATQQQLTLPATLMTGATAGDAFVILRSAAKASSSNGLWRIGTATGYYPNSSTAFTDGFGTNATRDLGTPQVDVTQRHLLEVTSTSDQWLARFNGLNQVRTDSNTVVWSPTPLLGHNGSYTLDGDIEEILIYDRALTDAERNQVRLHLNARHSLVSSAPSEPTSINLRAGVQGGADLSWSAPASVPAAWLEYIIERSTNGSVYAEIARTAWLNYTDTDAQPGHSYAYRIKVRNWAGESSYATSTTLALTANAALPALPAANNLRLWLRADQGLVTTANGSIQRWQDQSGRGNHAEQTLAANRPAFAIDSTINVAVVRFTAAQKQSFNFLDVMRGAVAAEVIVRVKTNSATYTADNSLWKWSTYGAAYPSKTNTLTDGTASTASQLQGAPVLPLNQWHTYTISAAAGQWISRLDGLEQYRAATNTVTFNTTPQLGTNGSTWFDGDIAEILIYDKALTESEREQLTRYLDARANPGDTTPPPAVPTGLSATAENATTIAVRWTPPANDDDSITYILERRTGAAGTFEEILRTTNGYATRSDYTDRALTPGTAYTYRLKARNNAGLESAYTALAMAATPITTAPDSTWPADIAPTNLRLWLRVDLGLVQNHDGRLITWEDQSGKNNHATQPTVANQPGVIAGAVTFDATQSQCLTLPASLFTGATAGDAFIVLKTIPSAPAATRGLWTLGASTNYYPQNTGELTESAGTSTARILGQPVTSTTAWHLYNITAAFGQWSARINGLEQLRDDIANTVKWSTAPKLGQGSAYFNGQIAEVIIYDRTLTTAERERLAVYLTGRHATLPVPPSPPAVPTSLTVTADTPSSAYLRWTLPDNVEAGVTYTLERRTTGSGDFVTVLTFAQGNATLRDNTDTTVEAGQPYIYRFRARDYLGQETIGAETATVVIPTAAAPGTLTQTAGLRLWLRADRGLAITSDGRVSAWQDQSGRNNNGNQATLANKPLAVSSAADGALVVLFDGAKNQSLALPSALTAGLTTGEAYIILKSNRVSGAPRGLWRLGYSSYSYYPNNDGTLWDDAGANAYRQQGAPKADITRKHLYRITSKAGEWTTTLNDFEQYRTATNTPYWNTAPLLGSNGSTGFEGEISEVLIYDHVLTDTERASVRQYLDQRHTLGITVAASPPASLTARETPPVGVELNWASDQLNIDATQVIERRVGNGAFSTLTTLPKNDRAYTDTTAQANQTYTYRIKTNAVTAGDSAWSNEATVTVTTTPTPATFATGMRLWLRAGQGLVTAGAGGITKWTDQSGKANHATQANLAYAVTANDDGTAHFEATRSQQLSLPATLMTGATAGDIFIVLKASTSTPANVRGLWRMGYSSYSYYPSANGTLSDDAGAKNSRSLGTPLADLTQWHLYNVSTTPDEWIARLNTLVQARFITNTVQWATAPALGFNGNSYFDGDIAELIAYDHALTNTERAAVENYLAAKYRLDGPNALPAPSDFAVQSLATTQASLSWVGIPTAWTWYEIERKTAAGTYYKTTDVHGLSCLDSTLTPDSTYTYRARSRSATAASEWSQEITLTTASSSDDTAALPTASLRLWLKADTLIPGALNTVGTWSDQSPNNNNATAPTLATAPILGRDTAGRPLAHFDAAKSQQLVLPAALMGNTTEGELFILLKTTTATPASVRGLWRMGYSSYSYYPSTNGTLTDDAGTSTSRTLGAPLTDTAQWHLYNISSKPSEWIARLNGTEQARATTNTVKWSAAPTLGFSGNNYFDGDIAEVLAFDHVLTAVERDTVKNYLAGRHRLAGQDNILPAPASLDATAVNSTQNSLRWDAALSPWITYELQRKTTGAEYVTISGNLGGLSHLDSNLATGVTCTYRVRARSATAASAWSNEVTVVTPADGTAALPVSSLRLWLKADTLATGTLSGWPDQSGLRNNAIAPTLVARPVVTTDATTHRNTVHFDASKAQYLNLPDLMAGVTEGETFVLLKTTVAKPATTRGLLRMGYSSYSYYPNSNGTLTDDTGTSTTRALGTPLTDITSWHIYNVSSKTGEWVARLNGTEQLRATTNTVKWSTAPLLGFNGSYYFDGDIAEVLVFDRVLTSAERASVQTYLQARQLPVSPPEIPTPPGNVSATATAWNNINLTWTTSPTISVTYELERKTGAASTYAKIADLANSVIDYTDTNLAEQTAYTYRLRAKLGTQYSTYTAEVTAITPAKPLPPPAIPANPTIGSVTGTSVTLTWSGPTDASISYEIERSTDGTAFAKITTVTGALTYTDTGLAPGTTYYYRILARNSSGASAYTAALDATTTPPSQPPVAPTSLAANATGTSTISLTWTATPTTGATYQLERKTGAGAFAKIADITAGTTTYADTGLTAATTYTYCLRATKDGLFSAYTAEASATTTTPPPPPPAAPSNPAIGSITGTSITLTWSGPTDASITYEVERSTDGTTYTKITTVTGALTYTDIGLTPGSTYYYRILARNSSGASAYTTALTATTTPPPQPPAAPSELAASATGTSTIALTWTTSPTTSTTYQLERKAGSGAFAKIADIAAGATTYADTGLTAATPYTYRLRSAKDGLFSTYTAEASATTDQDVVPPVEPGIPSSLIATAQSGSVIRIQWSASGDASTTYGIERKTASDATFTQIGQITGQTAYSDNNLQPETTYTYRLRAGNIAGWSGYSVEVSATTLATSSGDTHAPPSANMRLWLHADAGVTADGTGAVTAWLDQSGHALTGTTTGAGANPKRIDNALNALPILRFDGTANKFTFTGVMTGAAAGEVFIVLKSTAANGSTNGLWTLGGSTGTQYTSAVGKIADDFGSNSPHTAVPATIGGTAPTTLTTPHLYNAGAGSGYWFSEINGAWLSSYSQNQASFPAAITLGAAGATAFAGDVAEVILYDHPLTAAEREQAGAYLVQKYKLFSPPTVPDTFQAVALSPYSIGLRWSPSQPGVTYTVEREVAIYDETAEDNVKKVWQSVGELHGDEGSTIIDTDLLPATHYSYRLRIRNLAGEASGILFAEATTLAAGSSGGGGGDSGTWDQSDDLDSLPRLSAPENLCLREQTEALNQDTSPLYTLDWDAVAVSANSKITLAGYRVYADDVLVGETASDVTTFALDPATLSRGYHLLTVVAVDQHGRESDASNALRLEIDPLINVDTASTNRQFRATIQLRRIINIMTPAQPGSKAWTMAQVGWGDWGMEASCYPNTIRAILWEGSPMIAELSQLASPKTMAYGRYRMMVKNYDGRARRLRFRWAEVFCPFPAGTNMGTGADQQYRPDTTLIGEIHEEIIEVKAGETEAYGQEYQPDIPTTRGQVRVYMLNPGVDIGLAPASSSDVDAPKPPTDISTPGTNHSYVYRAADESAVIESSGEGTPDPITQKPTGQLYPLYIGPGMHLNVLRTGSGLVMPIESITLTVQDPDAVNGPRLRIYAEEIATGQFSEITPGQDLRAPYFATATSDAKYRYYIKGVKDGKVTLVQTLYFANTSVTEETKITILPGDDLFRVDANRDGKIDDADRNLITTDNPWRFWINDDADDGDVCKDDIPGQPAKKANYRTTTYSGNTGPSYGQVGGRTDLIDFFPVWLDIDNLLAAFPPGLGVKYSLKHEDSALNFVISPLAREQALDYQTKDLKDIYPGFPYELHDAITQQITKVGVELEQGWLEAAATKHGLVLLIEGRAETQKPLVLEIQKDGVTVIHRQLALKMSSIEKMYRWVNIRHAAWQNETTPTNTDQPENWPDTLTNGKNFVMLHGYNVSENQSRGWGSETFKRMFWSGSRARHYFVSWHGDETQLAGAFTPNFHVTVEHALRTAPALRDFLNTLSGETTTCAHSLGNMVVLESLNLKTNPARIARHFAFDAAVPAEALDGALSATTPRPEMTHSDWDNSGGTGVNGNPPPDKIDRKLWASEWYKLFQHDPGDMRGYLTWRDRLANSLTNATVYNFYSSGEQVLNYSADKPTLDATTALAGIAGYHTAQGELAWWGQEIFKGRFIIDNVLGSDYGGWWVSKGWQIKTSIVVNGHTVEDYRQPTTQEIQSMSSWDDNTIRTKPLFLYGTDKKIASIPGADEESVSELYGPNGSAFAAKHYNKLLADVFPATTVAMGREGIARLNKNPDSSITIRNFDLSDSTDPNGSLSQFQSGWPQERIDNNDKHRRWLHGDTKDIAYFYNYPLWIKWVELGSLNQ